MKFTNLKIALCLSASSLFASENLSPKQVDDEINRTMKKKDSHALLRPYEEKNPKIKETKKAKEKIDEIFKKVAPGISISQEDMILLEEKGGISSTKKQYTYIMNRTAEIIYHHLNDTLSFLITRLNSLKRDLKETPDLIKTTNIQILKNTEELFLEFPFKRIKSGLFDVVQEHLVYIQHRYWIDIIYKLKNAVFRNSSFSSFNHDSAVIIKPFVEDLLLTLKNVAIASKTIIDLLPKVKNGEPLELGFVSSESSFYCVLSDCLTRMAKDLPDSFISVEDEKHPTASISIEKQRKHIEENLLVSTTVFSTVFYDESQKTLTNIRDMAESFPIHMNNASFDENLKKLYETYKFYIYASQKQRELMNLPGSIIKEFDFEERFYKAIEKEKMFLQKKEEPVITPKIKEKLPLVEKKEIVESRTQTLIEEEKESEKVEEETEKQFFFDSSTYFKEQHEFHQQRKRGLKASSSSTSEEKLSDYEVNLFNFLLNRIFHPKYKPTWDELVRELADFGFEGRPNKAGNGSTWVFSVTQHNKLFFSDENYRGATFNVHEFKGNDPIHPAYLSYVQSGFSNVFGLTEEYLMEALGSQWNKK